MDPIDRRAFTTSVALTLSTAALASATDAGAQHATRAPPAVRLLSVPAEHVVAPLPFAPASIPGFSERLLSSHHANNYTGAVRKLNEIRQQIASADPTQSGPYWSMYGSLRSAELAARNSALLHELYFANLAPAQAVPPALSNVVSQRYASVDRFRAHMLGAAKASNGWVALVADTTSRTLEIVQTDGHAFGAWEAAPLLVLDMFEHAYAIDFGANKTAYFDAFWRNIAWTEVARRTARAIARL